MGDRSNIEVTKELVKVPGVAVYENTLGGIPIAAAWKARKRDVVELLLQMGNAGSSPHIQAVNTASDRLDIRPYCKMGTRDLQRFERWLKGLAYIGVRDAARIYEEAG